LNAIQIGIPLVEQIERRRGRADGFLERFELASNKANAEALVDALAPRARVVEISHRDRAG
jgi:hypothetical protein